MEAVNLIFPLGISAVILWFLGRGLNGRVIEYGDEHTFMFIKIEYWALLLTVAVAVNLIRQIG